MRRSPADHAYPRGLLVLPFRAVLVRMETTTGRLEPRLTRYADVNGVHMYFEVYGEGSPLVLLHGGMMTIDLNFATLIPTLATQHRSSAWRCRGTAAPRTPTGRSRRRRWPATSSALLDHLGIDRAHVFGHSMGGAVALELAVSYPDRVRSVVPTRSRTAGRAARGPRRPGQAGDLDPDADAPGLPRDPGPTSGSRRIRTTSTSSSRRCPTTPTPAGWSDEQLAGIAAPTLLVIGDRDFTTVEHGAAMLELIPGSQLAVLPGTTHMPVTRRADLLLPMLAGFLD